MPTTPSLGFTCSTKRRGAGSHCARGCAGSRYALGLGNEGKYFHPTKAQAEAIATKYETAGFGNYTVTSASVDDSVLNAGAVGSISVDGEGDAWYFLEAGLEAVGELAIIE